MENMTFWSTADEGRWRFQDEVL